MTGISTYTHVVSARYLLSKLQASLPFGRRVLAALSRLVPAALPVPVNLGDNMLVCAKKPL